MGILNALKDLFKGKGGTSVDDFNICLLYTSDAADE